MELDWFAQAKPVQTVICYHSLVLKVVPSEMGMSRDRIITEPERRHEQGGWREWHKATQQVRGEGAQISTV